MPYINLKVAGKLTRQQKETIARQFAETLEKVAGKPKNATYLVIDEVERENWAQGDNLLG
jgi:4-oxalocrotonate tautomerase